MMPNFTNRPLSLVAALLAAFALAGCQEGAAPAGDAPEAETPAPAEATDTAMPASEAADDAAATPAPADETAAPAEAADAAMPASEAADDAAATPAPAD